MPHVRIYSGSRIDPSWLTLDSSRGIETQGSKNFMRFTVLLLDLLIYVPAVLYFVKVWLRNRSPKTQVNKLTPTPTFALLTYNSSMSQARSYYYSQLSYSLISDIFNTTP